MVTLIFPSLKFAWLQSQSSTSGDNQCFTCLALADPGLASDHSLYWLMYCDDTGCDNGSGGALSLIQPKLVPTKVVTLGF